MCQRQGPVVLCLSAVFLRTAAFCPLRQGTEKLQPPGDQHHRDGCRLQVRTTSSVTLSPSLCERRVSFLCVCGFVRDVQDCGLSRSACLSESDQCDAVLCALVIDLDFDGQMEVLLGTYGQVRLSLHYTSCVFIKCS